MEWLTTLINIFLHLDTYLEQIISQYGTLTYAILFLIIFAETGLVITPFLPGDSLLFAAGALASLGGLNIYFMFLLLTAAAIIGDAVNYSIGRAIGKRAFSSEIKWLKKEYLERTHAFYEKHGGKTIFLARFVPIVRTFAPFIAGVSEMSYSYFSTYNVVGAIVWVGTFLFAGHFFGEMPIVKQNFELIMVAIVVVSVVPAVYEALKARQEEKEKKTSQN